MFFIGIIGAWFLGYFIEKKGILSAERELGLIQNIEGNKANWNIIMKEIIIPEIKKLLENKD